MSPVTRTSISWFELGERATEQDVVKCLEGLKKLSALTSLARINILLAVDRFRRDPQLTATIQTFLAGSFLDQEIIDRLKRKVGSERLNVRPIFHSQQVLFLSRYVLLHCPDDSGADTELEEEARWALGKALLQVSDLLVPTQIAADLRDMSMARTKKAIRLQLSAASGFEVNNPPDMRSSVVRSDTMFGDILKRTASDLDLSSVFRERTGIGISEYLDHNIGVLVNFLATEPKELMENAGKSFLNVKTFFPTASQESSQKFWGMELGTLAKYKDELTSETKLAPYHNFTPFRKRPFFQATDDLCLPIHPCFVQEKLETGLFWTIFHTMRDGKERDALFSLWGRLFETYVIENLRPAPADEKARFIPFPKYSDNGQEAFDGILFDGKVCVVLECKGGFLKAESKFSDDPEKLLPDLDAKFGSSKSGALPQIASHITQVFSKRRDQRRNIEGLDLGTTRIIVPVLVVQEKFVSSPLTALYLADSFRSVLRKQRLTREIDCQCQGLVVVDAYDVEALRVCGSNTAFDISGCFLERSLHGDVVLDFHDFLIAYAQKNGISLKSDPDMDKRFAVIFDRISERFFGRPLAANSA